MTSKPLLAASADKKLSAFITKPSHALLITGAAGAGKSTTAAWLSSELLGVVAERLHDYPYYLHIAPEGASISIEKIRTLDHVLALKVPSNTRAVQRVIVIEQADVLTHEAQNALLKTLEEPPQGTLLIMTAIQADHLLPTVRSRLQAIAIGLPDRQALRQLLLQHESDSVAVDRIVSMSAGLPGVALSLVTNRTDHYLVRAANDARQILQARPFERLCLVDGMSKDRERSQHVIAMLMQMSHISLLDGKAASRWQQVLEASFETDRLLRSGAQPKLALTNLMLTL